MIYEDSAISRNLYCSFFVFLFRDFVGSRFYSWSMAAQKPRIKGAVEVFSAADEHSFAAAFFYLR